MNLYLCWSSIIFFRLRLNCVGIFDVLSFDANQANPLHMMPHYQVFEIEFYHSLENVRALLDPHISLWLSIVWV